MICPPSRTMIWSASSIEETRCAMMILVVFGISSRNAFRIRASVFVSTALVESSRIRIFGFLRSALAIHRRCFCHRIHCYLPGRFLYCNRSGTPERIRQPAQAYIHVWLLHRLQFHPPADVFINGSREQYIFWRTMDTWSRRDSRL